MGIVQARILEWVVPGVFLTQGLQADALLSEPPGKPEFLQCSILVFSCSVVNNNNNNSLVLPKGIYDHLLRKIYSGERITYRYFEDF